MMGIMVAKRIQYRCRETMGKQEMYCPLYEVSSIDGELSEAAGAGGMRE